MKAVENDQAGVLALALFASPLVFRFSFNFMTDVPFLVSLIVALLIYSQAIRRESAPLMVLASIAAAASVLTRQFGVVLIGGLALTGALDRHRRRRAPLCVLGLALPLAAAGGSLAYAFGGFAVGHFPGQRWYGNTKEGQFMTEKEAHAAGYRPTHNGQ